MSVYLPMNEKTVGKKSQVSACTAADDDCRCTLMHARAWFGAGETQKSYYSQAELEAQVVHLLDEGGHAFRKPGGVAFDVAGVVVADTPAVVQQHVVVACGLHKQPVNRSASKPTNKQANEHTN
jgi:hypothetical protein